MLPVTSTPPGTWARRDSTRSPLRASVGPKDGTALNVAIAPSGEVTGSVTPTMSSRASISRISPVVSAVADLVAVDDEHERAVEAGAVLLGDQVVGLAGGQVRRLRARGPAARCACRARGAPAGSSPARRRSPTGSGVRPTLAAQRAVSGGRAVAGSCCRTPNVKPRRTLRGSSLRPASRDRAGTSVSDGGHHGDDGERGGEAERGVDLEAGQAQAHQRDQHRAGGEDHRAARRGDGAPGGVGDQVSGPERTRRTG